VNARQLRNLARTLDKIADVAITRSKAATTVRAYKAESYRAGALYAAAEVLRMEAEEVRP
jgi:ATP phosphoribosyltransferase regulatory subunit HisZ